jgi:hypothetical protein
MSTGLDAQIGFAEETTYGTPVTVDRFYEFLSEEIKTEKGRVESQGLRSGARVQRSSRWVAGPQQAGGEVEFELANKGFGRLLKHMFGNVATSTPGGGTLTRDHTFTPASLDTLSLTMQIGRPPVTAGAAAQAFTYHGSKIAEWELECAVGAIPKLTLALLSEEEDTATALAAASYPSGLATFAPESVTLSVAGSAVTDVEAITIRGNNTLKDDRFNIGSTKRRNPLEVGLREYTGEFSGEFVDLTAYNRFINGTEVALVLLMEGATIEGSLKYHLQFTCNVRFDGETPTVGGPELVEQPLSFKCLNTGSGDGTAITAVYRTTDTTP